ncbi:MAG: hypothetical protein ABH869_02180 [Candidatus Omnitrophota bacterium]
MTSIKLNKREAVLAIIVSLIVAVFIIERMVVSPFLEKAKSMTVETEAKERQLARILQIDSQRESITGSMDKVSSYIEIKEQGEGLFSVIMKKIEEMSQENRIVLLNMKPKNIEGKKGESYEIKNIALNIEGVHHNIIRFMYQLENGEYLLRINRLDLKVKDRPKGIMSATLDVYLIYFR